MKKVLLVATVQSHISQFHLPMVKMLKEKGYIVHVAARNNLDEKPGRNLKSVDVVYDVAFSRSPYSIENLKAYKKLKKLIETENYDIVHCNTPVGGILARLACIKRRKQGLTKVIYTAHGFHFYTGGSKVNWILYYPIEKVFSCFTDVLITITKGDFERARKKFHATKVIYVPGVGVDIDKFSKANFDKNEKKKLIGIKESDFVLISVGELNSNKNHEAVIRVLAKLSDRNIKYIIAGNGPNKEKLVKLTQTLNLEKSVYLLGYRTDISELLQISDVYCFPSKREGLSLSIMEAMSCGLPCVVSKIRGNVDLIIQGKGGELFSTRDEKKLIQILNSFQNNHVQLKSMGKYNKNKVEEFSLEEVMNTVKMIYGKL